MKRDRMKFGGYCSLNKTKDECHICNRNKELLESRKMASFVEKMKEEK